MGIVDRGVATAPGKGGVLVVTVDGRTTRGARVGDFGDALRDSYGAVVKCKRDLLDARVALGRLLVALDDRFSRVVVDDSLRRLGLSLKICGRCRRVAATLCDGDDGKIDPVKLAEAQRSVAPRDPQLAAKSPAQLTISDLERIVGARSIAPSAPGAVGSQESRPSAAPRGAELPPLAAGASDGNPPLDRHHLAQLFFQPIYEQVDSVRAAMDRIVQLELSDDERMAVAEASFNYRALLERINTAHAAPGVLTQDDSAEEIEDDSAEEIEDDSAEEIEDDDTLPPLPERAHGVQLGDT